MESTLSIKPLNLHFSNTTSILIPRCIHTHRFSQAGIFIPAASLSYSSPLRSISSSTSVPKRLRRRLRSVSSSAASSDGSGGGGDSKAKSGAGVADDVSALSPDVIILDVGGMSCGGCVASVKKILESQPQVTSASVDLTTERAMVWPVSEAKAMPNWQKELGDALAKQLTSCGFKSNLRVAGEEAIEGNVSP